MQLIFIKLKSNGSPLHSISKNGVWHAESWIYNDSDCRMNLGSWKLVEKFQAEDSMYLIQLLSYRGRGVAPYMFKRVNGDADFVVFDIGVDQGSVVVDFQHHACAPDEVVVNLLVLADNEAGDEAGWRYGICFDRTGERPKTALGIYWAQDHSGYPYISSCQTLYNPSLWLSIHSDRLTNAALRCLLRWRAQLIGRKDIPTPYDFRRPFALQKLTGHSDLQVLRRYLA
jgi:hypothetical protein